MPGLKKEISIGDKIHFDVSLNGTFAVDIELTDVVGRRAILLITANREGVPIRHTKANRPK